MNNRNKMIFDFNRKLMLGILKRSACNFLGLFIPISDSPFFYPLHHTVRILCLKSVPILNFLCQFSLQTKDISIIPRHSAATGHKFNFLVSDLDLSAIFSINSSNLEIKKLDSLFSWIRFFFPWIGELEYYSAEEFRERVALETDHGAYLNFIWCLRKLSWLEKSPSRFTSAYHYRKNTRAWRITVRKIAEMATSQSTPVDSGDPAEAVSRFLRQYFPPNHLGVPTAFLGKSAFLGRGICGQGHHGGLEYPEFLILPEREACLLAATLPDGQSIVPPNFPLKKLRAQPLIRASLLATVKLEILLNYNALRQDPSSATGRLPWIDHLRSILTELKDPTPPSPVYFRPLSRLISPTGNAIVPGCE